MSSIVEEAQNIVDGESSIVRVEEQARVWAVGDSPVCLLFDGTGLLYASDAEPAIPKLKEVIITRARIVANRILTNILQNTRILPPK